MPKPQNLSPKGENTENPIADKDLKQYPKGKRYKGNRKSQNKHGGNNLKAGNGPEWYKNYPELMKDADNYQWMHIKGFYFTGKKTKVEDACVTTMYFTPSVGASRNASSPINLCFRKLWIEMNKAYRGIGSYESADLAMANVAICSLYARFAEAMRFYGIAHTWVDTDRTTGLTMLQALGVGASEAEWLLANSADYRYRINSLVEQARSLILPKGFALLKSWVSLSGFLYRDAKDNPERSHTIGFCANGYYEYEENATNLPTCLVFKSQYPNALIGSAGTFATFKDYLDDIQRALNLLLESEDVNKMCADMLYYFTNKSAGEGAKYEVLPLLPEDYKILPEYSESILLKLHNCHMMPRFGDTVDHPLIVNEIISAQSTAVATYIQSDNRNQFVITQYGNNVYFYPSMANTNDPASWTTSMAHTVFNVNVTQPGFNSGNVSATSTSNIHAPIITDFDSIIDSWEDNPSEDTRIEATLWKTTFSHRMSGDNSKVFYTIESTGLEIITGGTVIRFADGVIQTVIPIVDFDFKDTVGTTAIRDMATALTRFDWHPIIKVLAPVLPVGMALQNYFASQNFIHELIGDLDNAAVISDENVKSIHYTALLSAYYLPYSNLISSK